MRVLLIINAAMQAVEEHVIAAGNLPRKDYLELQRRLDADVIDLDVLNSQVWTRILRRLGGVSLAQVALAWVRAGRYDAIFVDRESIGFALAALCKLRQRRLRLVMIGHLLSPARKRLFFRLLRLERQVTHVVVHSSLQQQIAEETLGLHASQVSLIPYQTDERFWAQVDVPLKRQICSAGLEFRDYRTLIEATASCEVDVVIAAASHWSKHQALKGHAALPPNLRIVSLDYRALRQLYAESLFVVVPLHDADNQAGITTILEAMAMGKAVVVSHTRGQTDVVRDRRRLSRVRPERPTQPGWARLLGVAEDTAQGHSGIYVNPGDPDELRKAITFLMAHPEQARVMGANGRRLVEETMSVDHFTSRIAALLTDEPRACASATTPIVVVTT